MYKIPLHLYDKMITFVLNMQNNKTFISYCETLKLSQRQTLKKKSYIVCKFQKMLVSQVKDVGALSENMLNTQWSIAKTGYE